MLGLNILGRGKAWPQQEAGSGEACVHKGPGVARDLQTDASEFRCYEKGTAGFRVEGCTNIGGPLWVVLIRCSLTRI